MSDAGRNRSALSQRDMKEGDRELIGGQLAGFIAPARARRDALAANSQGRALRALLHCPDRRPRASRSELSAGDVRQREFVDDVTLSVRAWNHVRRSDDLRDEWREIWIVGGSWRAAGQRDNRTRVERSQIGNRISNAPPHATLRHEATTRRVGSQGRSRCALLPSAQAEFSGQNLTLGPR